MKRPVVRMTWIGRPAGTDVEFAYDLSGNMTALVTPSEVEHDFLYDLLNQNTEYVTPLSGSYSYTYDQNRRLTAIDFPSGRQIENVFDQGRLVQTVTPEGNIDFTYNAGGLLDSMSRGTESVAYTYDGSVVTSEVRTGSMSATLSYVYNNNLDVTRMTYAGRTEYLSYGPVADEGVRYLHRARPGQRAADVHRQFIVQVQAGVQRIRRDGRAAGRDDLV